MLLKWEDLALANTILILYQYALCILTSFWVLRAPKSWSKYATNMKTLSRAFVITIGLT